MTGFFLFCFVTKLAPGLVAYGMTSCPHSEQGCKLQYISKNRKALLETLSVYCHRVFSFLAVLLSRVFRFLNYCPSCTKFELVLDSDKSFKLGGVEWSKSSLSLLFMVFGDNLLLLVALEILSHIMD